MWGRKLWRILSVTLVSWLRADTIILVSSFLITAYDLRFDVYLIYWCIMSVADSFTSQEEENPGRKELFELIKSSFGL